MVPSAAGKPVVEAGGSGSAVRDRRRGADGAGHSGSPTLPTSVPSLLLPQSAQISPRARALSKALAPPLSSKGRKPLRKFQVQILSQQVTGC